MEWRTWQYVTKGYNYLLNTNLIQIALWWREAWLNYAEAGHDKREYEYQKV